MEQSLPFSNSSQSSTLTDDTTTYIPCEIGFHIESSGKSFNDRSNPYADQYALSYQNTCVQHPDSPYQEPQEDNNFLYRVEDFYLNKEYLENLSIMCEYSQNENRLNVQTLPHDQDNSGESQYLDQCVQNQDQQGPFLYPNFNQKQQYFFTNQKSQSLLDNITPREKQDYQNQVIELEQQISHPNTLIASEDSQYTNSMSSNYCNFSQNHIPEEFFESNPSPEMQDSDSQIPEEEEEEIEEESKHPDPQISEEDPQILEDNQMINQTILSEMITQLKKNKAASIHWDNQNKKKILSKNSMTNYFTKFNKLIKLGLNNPVVQQFEQQFQEILNQNEQIKFIGSISKLQIVLQRLKQNKNVENIFFQLVNELNQKSTYQKIFANKIEMLFHLKYFQDLYRTKEAPKHFPKFKPASAIPTNVPEKKKSIQKTSKDQVQNNAQKMEKKAIQENKLESKLKQLKKFISSCDPSSFFSENIQNHMNEIQQLIDQKSSQMLN